MTNPAAPSTGPGAATELGRLGVASVSVFGLGYLRPAPGTWGSLPPAAAAAALLALGAPPAALFAVLAAVLVLASAACVRFGAAAVARYGRKDPSHVVADETAGQCVALAPAPWLAATLPGAWGVLAPAVAAGAAFVAFRIADIIKPPPARGLERLPAGWGILVDDLVAGAYAAAAVALAAAAL